MKQITKLAGCVYFEGDFSMRDLNSNYAYPCEFPTIFTAKGKGIKSGNWQSCTGTNTPDYINKYYSENVKGINSNYDIVLPNLTDSDKYELFGLWDSIAKMAEAYTVVKFGNHGTSEGTDISNKDASAIIFEAIKPMVERANELFNKLPKL